MEITAAIPLELIPVFLEHPDLRSLSLRQALLILKDCYPLDDNMTMFSISAGWHGIERLKMSIGGRIRLFYGNLMSRPIMLQYAFGDLLDASVALQRVNADSPGGDSGKAFDGIPGVIERRLRQQVP